MSVATLRHNSTLITNHTSSSSNSAGQISSRSGSSGELLHTQLQQGGGGGHSTAIAASTHAQASGIWDLASSTDMSYELAAAGTGKNLDHFFVDSIFEFEYKNDRKNEFKALFHNLSNFLC